MNLLTKIERKLDWLAFPGLFKCLTLIGVLVYAISWTQPTYGALIDFDKAKILAGEWWRIPTFLFASRAGSFSPIALLFLFCAVSFAFLISDALEQAWGATRTTLFLLFGWLCLFAGNWLAPAAVVFPGSYLFGAAFLAFAWFNPDFTLRLFFFIPVPCHWLAKFQLAVLIFSAITAPAIAPFLLLAHLNLLIWIGPALWQSRRSLFKARAKRREFEARQRPLSNAFHTCTVCARTEHHKPSLDFRVGHDGQEYCEEHLP